MLTDFDNTLKQLLIQRVPFDPNEVDVSFECPRREWASKVLKPTVNLYLFDLRQNTDMSQAGSWAVQRGENGQKSGRQRPPIHVDLSYFITTWARDVADEHHLLWRVMTALMREPVIESDVLQGALKQVGPPIKTTTALSDGVLRNSAEFWGALDNDLKPAVTYTATLLVDLDVLVEAPLVLTRIIDLGDIERSRRSRAVEIGGTVWTRSGKKGAPAVQPIAAEVAFPRLGISVRSGGDGRYVVPDIPEGTHRVHVTTAAGATVERDVTVPAASYDLEVQEK